MRYAFDPKRIDAIIAAMPGTLEEISYAIGVTRETAARYIKFLRRNCEAHISSWQSARTAVYSADYAADAVPPASRKKSPIQRDKERKNALRIKRDREELRAIQAARTASKSDPFALPLAFFGRAA